MTVPMRPSSAWEAGQLLDAVAEVARRARPEGPEDVSQRAWDAARPRTGRYASAPAARHISERLGLSWKDAVAIALLPPGTRDRELGHRLRAAEQDWLTHEHVAFALRMVARRLNAQTVSVAQYRAERNQLLSEERRRRRHGGQLRLPTDEQILFTAGGWNAALRLAGLEGHIRRGGQINHVRPVSIVEVLERCFSHHGTEPTSSEVEVFARANGIPFPRRELGRPWSDYLREWKQSRVELGLPIPDGPPPKTDRPDYGRDVGAALPGERRARKTGGPIDEVVEWVEMYLRALPSNARASQRGYNAWARNVDGAPWASSFRNYGGWSAVLAAARDTHTRQL